MKYVLLIMDTPTEPAPGTPEYNAWYAEVGAWYEKWGATGKLEGGHQLQGSTSAKTASSVMRPVRNTTVWNICISMSPAMKTAATSGSCRIASP